jgi:hypothetical protein
LASSSKSSPSVKIMSMLLSEIKLVMLNCILLSAKSNNCHMEANDLAQISNINVNLIRDMELKMLSFLNFDLFFFNPYYSISSLLSSIHDINNQDDDGKEDELIWKEMDELATGDAILIFSPSIIALSLAYKHYEDRLVEWLLEQDVININGIVKEQINKRLKDSLSLLMEHLKLASEPIDNKKLRQIDKKIKEKIINGDDDNVT